MDPERRLDETVTLAKKARIFLADVNELAKCYISEVQEETRATLEEANELLTKLESKRPPHGSFREKYNDLSSQNAANVRGNRSPRVHSHSPHNRGHSPPVALSSQGGTSPSVSPASSHSPVSSQGGATPRTPPASIMGGAGRHQAPLGADSDSDYFGSPFSVRGADV